MTKLFDKQSNPAALIKVMPCFKGQAFPVAVFIKYHNSNFWQQHSKQYYYKKCADNKAKEISQLHFAYKYLGDCL